MTVLPLCDSAFPLCQFRSSEVVSSLISMGVDTCSFSEERNGELDSAIEYIIFEFPFQLQARTSWRQRHDLAFL